MADGKDRAARELMSLQPGSLLNLYRLYPDYVSKPDYFFDIHDGSVFQKGVVWQGLTYQPMGIEAEGFETSANGRLNRPKMRISNKDYFVTNLAENNEDFKNGKVIRKRVFLKFLDDINFDGGNPFGEADPTAELFNEEYLVSQKTQENKTFVEFELTSPLDLDEFEVNNRRIFSKYCYWKYRGEGCGYQGPPLQKADGKPFVDGQDVKLGLLGGSDEDFEYADYNDLYDPIKAYQQGEIVFKENNRVTIADPEGIEEPKPLLTYYVARENVSGFDPEKNPRFWERDGCNKKLSSCKLRFFEPFDRDVFLPKKNIYNYPYQLTGGVTDTYDIRESRYGSESKALLLRFPGLQEPYGEVGDYTWEKTPIEILKQYDFESTSADTISAALNGSGDFTLMMILRKGEERNNTIDNGILQTTWNLNDGLRLSFQGLEGSAGLGIGMYYSSKDSNGNYIERNNIISDSQDLNQNGLGDIPFFIENNSGNIKSYFPTLTANGYENPTWNLNLNSSNEVWDLDFHELGLGVMPNRFDDGEKITASNPSYNYRAYYINNLDLQSPASSPGDPWINFYDNFDGQYEFLTTTQGYPNERDTDGKYIRPYLSGVGDGLYEKQNEYAVYSGVSNDDAFIYFSTGFAGWVFAKNDYGTDDVSNDKYIINYTGLHDLSNLQTLSDLLSPADNHIMEYDITQPDRRGSFVFDPSGFDFFASQSGAFKASVFGSADFLSGIENPYSGEQSRRFNSSAHGRNIIPQKYGWNEPNIKIKATAIWDRLLRDDEKESLFVIDNGKINVKTKSLLKKENVELTDESLIAMWDKAICKESEARFRSESVPIFCEIQPPQPNCPFRLTGVWEPKAEYCCQDGSQSQTTCKYSLGLQYVDKCFEITSYEEIYDFNNDEFFDSPIYTEIDGGDTAWIISLGLNDFTNQFQWFINAVFKGPFPPEEALPADYCDDNTWNPDNEEEIIIFKNILFKELQQEGPFGEYGDENPDDLLFVTQGAAAPALNDDIGDLYPGVDPPPGYYICGYESKVVRVDDPPVKFVCDSSRTFDPQSSKYTLWSTDMLYNICALSEKITIKNKITKLEEESYNLPFGGFPGTDPFQFRTKL